MFDAAAFAEMVRVKMARDRLSVRDVEAMIGVSHATVSRVARGGPPNVETFLRLSKWLGWRWTPPNAKTPPAQGAGGA